MVCQYCRGEFCYFCTEKIAGYSHFSSSSCPLFSTYAQPQDAPPVTRFHKKQQSQQQIQAQQRAANQLAPEFATKQCPHCSFVHIKFYSNNRKLLYAFSTNKVIDIKCQNCRKYFCFTCGQKTSQNTSHYEPPNTCKQHAPLTPANKPQ